MPLHPLPYMSAGHLNQQAPILQRPIAYTQAQIHHHQQQQRQHQQQQQQLRHHEQHEEPERQSQSQQYHQHHQYQHGQPSHHSQIHQLRANRQHILHSPQGREFSQTVSLPHMSTQHHQQHHQHHHESHVPYQHQHQQRHHHLSIQQNQGQHSPQPPLSPQRQQEQQQQQHNHSHGGPPQPQSPHHLPTVHPQTHPLTHHLSHSLPMLHARSQHSPQAPTPPPPLRKQQQHQQHPKQSEEQQQQQEQQKRDPEQQSPYSPPHGMMHHSGRKRHTAIAHPSSHSLSTVSQQAPPCSLSTEDVALISQTYVDLLALLRDNPVACQWFFQWVLNPSVSVDDATRLDISRSRGFRTLHVCVTSGCASFEPHSVLQKCASLLLPVETHDTLVLGYFIDSCADHNQPNLPRIGKYVYCTNNHQLLRVSKVRGPPSASHLSSVIINKTVLFNNAMFVGDYVMASFLWADQATTSRPPTQYVVHSRSLTFQKLVQAAPRAGLGIHLDAFGDSGVALDATDDMGMLDNSFFGLGAFGVYEATLVPSGLPLDAQTDGADATPLSVGKWAIPEHCTVCNTYQVLHLGLLRNEASALRAQFLQAFGHVNRGTSVRPVSAPAATPYGDEPSPFAERGVDERTAEFSRRTDDELGYGAAIEYGGRDTNVEGGLSSVVAGSGSGNGSGGNGTGGGGGSGNGGTLDTGRGPSLAARVSAAAAAFGEPPHTATGVGADIIADKDVTTDSTDLTKPGHVGLSQAFHQAVGVDDVLHDVPSTVVDSIDTVTHVNSIAAPTVTVGVPCAGNVSVPVSTADVAMTPHQPRNVGPFDNNGAPSPAQFQNASSGGGNLANKESLKADHEQLDEIKAEPGKSPGADEGKVGGITSDGMTAGKPFKKTLPAPTKSEIVIRNRISAQRSNEKRRRKIEATKSELAYLKMTYLPHLEHRRGSLVNENERLRLKFRERYHETEISSFF